MANFLYLLVGAAVLALIGTAALITVGAVGFVVYVVVASAVATI